MADTAAPRWSDPEYKRAYFRQYYQEHRAEIDARSKEYQRKYKALAYWRKKLANATPEERPRIQEKLDQKIRELA